MEGNVDNRGMNNSIKVSKHPWHTKIEDNSQHIHIFHTSK